MSFEEKISKFNLSEEETAKYVRRHDRMVTEFAIPEQEADRTIIQEIEKALGLSDENGRRTANPMGIGLSVNISNLNPESMSDADVLVKVVSLTRGTSGKIAYRGILADATGYSPFAVLNGCQSPPLDQGRTYAMFGACLSRYNGILSLLFNKFSFIESSDVEIDTKPYVRTLLQDLKPGVCDIQVKILRMSTDREKYKYVGSCGD